MNDRVPRSLLVILRLHLGVILILTDLGKIFRPGAFSAEMLGFTYHRLYGLGHYEEAEVRAMAAHDLDPDDTASAAAVKIARIQRNQAKFDAVKDRKEKMFVDALDEAEDPGP